MSSELNRADRRKEPINYRVFHEVGHRSEADVPEENIDSSMSEENSSHSDNGGVSRVDNLLPSAESSEPRSGEGEVAEEVAHAIHEAVGARVLASDTQDDSSNHSDILGDEEEEDMADQRTVVEETPMQTPQGEGGTDLHAELEEADWTARKEAAEAQEKRLAEEAAKLAERYEVEKRKRKVRLLQRQIQQLNQAREQAQEEEPIITSEDEQDPATKKLLDTLKKLEKEKHIREKKKEEARRQS